MRRSFWLNLILLASIVTIAVATPVSAQRPPIEFRSVQVGLPPGRFVANRTDQQQAAPVFKNQFWTPIYLDLQLNEAVRSPALLRVESSDDDDLRTRLTVPLGNFSDRNPGEQIRAEELPYLPYVRTGGSTSDEVSLRIYDAEGTALSEPRILRFLPGRDKSTYVILSLGSNLPGFDLPRGEQTDAAESAAPASGALRNGRVETAAITRVRQLPDRWLGYSSVDLVVLCTGSAATDFLADLLSNPAFGSRRDALFEWIRRGGRLLISVGSNAELLSQYPILNELLPAPWVVGEPSRAVPDLQLNWQAPGGLPKSELLRGSPGSRFPLARFDPDRSSRGRVLLRHKPAPTDRDQTPYPLIMQSPYGLGRITLVAFDLDRSPFLDLATPLKASFWDWLIRESGAERTPVGTEASAASAAVAFGENLEDGFAAAIKGYVDDFQEVPVISFGWVALLITFYLLLIGPVEYLFLKKVVGRLELTWITFPLIVITVSTIAYLTAYAIKGDDLRINKVDLVDIDLASNRIYGRSWFSIFSPRIDSYSIGIQPRAEWGELSGSRPVPATLVDWMPGSRSRTGNIISRSYDYHTELSRQQFADGLEQVPIQVWSTKAFQANWSCWLSASMPVIESRLYHPPGDPSALLGQIRNRLPIGSVNTAVLIYADAVYRLEPLVPGGTVTPIIDAATKESDWLRAQARLELIPDSRFSPGFGTFTEATALSHLSLWGLLFHEKALPLSSVGLKNASYRELDQSWRLRTNNLDEAILLARIGPVSGAAETLMSESQSPSPTQLWLRQLPSSGQPREPVPGKLRQETYIRVFLPVAKQAPPRQP